MKDEDGSRRWRGSVRRGVLGEGETHKVQEVCPMVGERSEGWSLVGGGSADT